MIGNNTNWVKAYIVDVLPCISIALFVLAYIYNSIFFSVFGIDIIQYATFSDILISITEPLCLYSLGMAVVMALTYDLYNVILPKWIQKREKQKEENSETNESSDTEDSTNKESNEIINYSNPPKYNSRKILFFIILILSVALFAIISTIEQGFTSPSLLFATESLLLPIAVIFFNIYIFYFGFGFDFIAPILLSIKKWSRMWVVAIIVYYVYSIAIFGIIGYERGKMHRDRNLISFEITTSSGQKYNDLKYTYIGHINEYTFLFDKKSLKNVILNNNGISSTEIVPIKEITHVAAHSKIVPLKNNK